jgi:hypothetical protein
MVVLQAIFGLLSRSAGKILNALFGWAVRALFYDEDPDKNRDSAELARRLDQVTRDLGELDVGFDDWQVLYRQILQVERAVRGQRQLMDVGAAKRGVEEPSTLVDLEVQPGWRS